VEDCCFQNYPLNYPIRVVTIYPVVGYTVRMDLTGVYRIKVRGRLDARWSDWFDGMAIACEIGSGGLPVTTITGAVADQAALRGMLWKLWDLNLRLISVIPVEMDLKD
jgi:hypothetical protein